MSGKMKIVCIVPIKKKSERVRGKNFKKINGIPLYQFTLRKLNSCKFHEVYVDTDSDEIKKYCIKNKINIINRLKYLSKNSANGNDLLNYHATIIEADIYFQLFVTSPILSIKTINKCINILKTKKKYDSIFTVKKIYSWFWFENKPVNYNPSILPRSQDAKPIIQETTGIYGIRKKALKITKSRIGKRPYLLNVSDDEEIDLDNKKDFQYLKFILKK
tara:strand:- start:183 stop:836 length:654 start_codon:yes stop_codon:yes gene_type:complete